MEGRQAVFEATGDHPIYPGHPLTVAWEIMSVFATPDDALSPCRTNGLNCPNAVADNRITGGGGEVQRACELLRKAMRGERAEDLIRWADACWVDGRAGGHTKAIVPGLAQAEKIKPLFEHKLKTWLGDAAA